MQHAYRGELFFVRKFVEPRSEIHRLMQDRQDMKFVADRFDDQKMRADASEIATRTLGHRPQQRIVASERRATVEKLFRIGVRLRSAPAFKGEGVDVRQIRRARLVSR